MTTQAKQQADSHSTHSLLKIPSISPWFINKLKQLDVTNMFQLVCHLPYRWDDRSIIQQIADIVPNQPIQIQGIIISSKRPFRNNLPWNIVVEDDSGTIDIAIFFKEKLNFKAPFTVGKTIRMQGEMKISSRAMRFTLSRWNIVDSDSKPDKLFTPIYRLTDKLTHAKLLTFIQQTLTVIKKELGHDPIDKLLKKIDSPLINNSLSNSLFQLHNRDINHPDPLVHSKNSTAMNRLILEELTSIYVSKQLDMAKIHQLSAVPIPYTGNLSSKLIKSLPFKLTNAQNKVLTEIHQLMDSKKPMATLLQGDVGSGKTLVALLAALEAIEQNQQVALIVPTEILAQQHTKNIREYTSMLGIEPALLSASVPAAKRKNILRDLKNGSLPLLIGTQSLLSEGLSWQNLGLVIIDEQHRFGVYQRNKLLMQEHSTPHLLSMTATPIPRTLMMTLYNNLDLLTLDEMPANRQAITTVIINQNKRHELINRVQKHIEEGGQVYWVCTLIDPNDQFSVKSIMQVQEELQQHLSSPIAILHGKMKSKEKVQQMQDFEAGKFPLLLATTVVEVGMDVPNATLVIIDGAQRLGLAQMHQIRGRVGRGSKKSFCVLLYDDDISQTSQSRLAAMRNSNDGFELAAIDLQLRQAGDLTGTDQAGKKTKFIDIRHDLYLLPLTLELGDQILKNEKCKQTLLARWESEVRAPETLL